MFRQIVYILLVVLLVILALLAIRWFLDRGDSEEAVTENGTALVEEEMSVAPPEVPSGEVAPEGETAVSPDTDASQPDSSTTDASVPSPTGEGETGTESAVDTTEGAADTTESTADASTEPGEAAAPTGDPAIGGVVDSGDPDVGGGVVAPPADTTGQTDVGGGGDVAATGTGGPTMQTTTVTPGVPVQHQVQQREWLMHLARCYGTTVNDLLSANYIPNPNIIYPGAILTISNPGNAGPITINDMPCFIYHTVQQGQTLTQIAQQYGIHIQWLARINGIYNYNYIQAGQVLIVPNPVPPELTVPPTSYYYYGY